MLVKLGITAYLDRLRHVDIFSEEGPLNPLRPTSLRNIEAHIRQYLDAAVASGHSAQNFTCLKDLIDVSVIKVSFQKIIVRNNGVRPVGLQNMAGTLLAIARHYVKSPPETIKAIQGIKSRVSRDASGMTKKNMDRLGQFDDWHNVVRLIGLPDELMAKAKKKPSSSRSAIHAMQAVAITILLSCPMRIGNLANLDIDQHLSFSQKGSQRRYMVRIEGRDVKNRNPIDFNLGHYQSKLLELYLNTFRSQLSDAPDNALFPKRSGGARSPASMGQHLTEMIYRETGLKVNAHLFRHFAGMLYLQLNPGDYETVRRLLGHKKIDTTTAFYARFDNKWALDRYDETVLSIWRSR